MAVTSGYNWQFCGRGIITACSKKILSTFDKRKRYEINEIKWFNCGASLNSKFVYHFVSLIKFRVRRTKRETFVGRWPTPNETRKKAELNKIPI